jgi:predicted transcriptional regulator
MQKDYTVIQHKARKALDLSFIEYVIADEIYHLSNSHLGWCYKSKANIAERFGISERMVFKAIQKLVDLGLVEKNENKQLKTTQKWYENVISKDYEQSAETMNKVHSDYEQSAVETMNKVHTKVTIESNIKTLDKSKGHEAYGKAEINEMFEAWEQVVGYAITGNSQKNRNACNNLLKKYGKDKLKQIIGGVAQAQSDKYAPRISDFISLQSKMNDLLLWGKQKNNTGRIVKI